MKIFFYTIIVAFVGLQLSFAQIGIGTTSPDPNAALDIESTTQGVLIPRMLKAQRELIGGGSPAAGMLVYQTDDVAGFYFYNGTAWVSLTTIKPSGLETVDEGNGNGLVRAGRNPNNYGNVGENAVDFSFSEALSATYGATGFVSTAMGRSTIASGFGSTAMGSFTTASQFGSTAMGYVTTASGDFSTAMGSFTTASGFGSTALGQGTQAESSVSTALGRYNVGGGSPSSIITTDPLFEIGNGINELNRSNAFTVLKNGNVGIGAGAITPSDKLVIEGGRLEVLDDIDASFLQGTGSIEVANSLRIDRNEIITNADSPLFLQQDNNGDFGVDSGTLYVDSSLNRVGIGTTSPSQALDVVGNAEINGTAIVTNNLQVDNTTLFVNASNNRVGIGTTDPLQNLSVIGNAEVTGRLGIGTASPIAKLDVNGDIFANGHVYGNRIAFTGFQDTAVDLQNINSPSTTLSLAFTDVTDNFNTLNSGVFTAPRSGLYFFSCSLSFSDGDGQDDTMWFGFSVNGSSSMSTENIFNPRTYTGSGREQAYSHSAVISLNSGNTVEVLIRDISATSPVKILDRTFTGYYLGDN